MLDSSTNPPYKEFFMIVNYVAVILINIYFYFKKMIDKSCQIDLICNNMKIYESLEYHEAK